MTRSRHFAVDEIAGGVFAAIALPGGGAVANAGIVDLGAETVLFDTTMTPAAASDLCAVATELTGRAPSKIVHSHWHGDHVYGTCALRNATIVSTERTAELVATDGAARLEAMRGADVDSYFRMLEDRASTAATPDERHEAALELQFAHFLNAELPRIAIVPPDVVFTKTLELDGAARGASCLELGGGHTESDAVLVLPDDGVIFTGDLVVTANHPLVEHGDLVHWLELLDRLEGEEWPVVVPGHGPVGDTEDVRRVSRYLRFIAETRENDDEPLPPEFEHWAHSDLLGVNRRAARDQLATRGT